MKTNDTISGADSEVASTNAHDAGSQPEKIQPKRSRKRRIIIFSVVSLINVGLLILLWTQLLTPAVKSNQGNGGYTPTDQLKGHAAPNFTLAGLSTSGGQLSPISLASFKGKDVVLNFWSSSCGPCQDEAHMLQTTWLKMKAKGVVFVGVDFQDTTTDGLFFMRRYGITYPNVSDPNGSTAVNYGVAFTPTTYFINSKGIVVNAIPQEMTAQQLQQNLQLLLKSN
jgi:cytochrome c biogenesis protein CcmG/thiol:disulfide interchange protein DsbE